jgi:hypothetical protein
MKAFVVLLALLFAAKLAHQEYLYRVATRDALVGAYRDRAVQACAQDARTPFLGLGPQAWANAEDVRLAIGNGNLDVRFWQLGHELWNARYRNPYLFLSTPERSGTVHCDYDIVNAAATVYR